MEKKYLPGERLAAIAKAKREKETEELVKRTVEFFLGNTHALLELLKEYDDLTKKMLEDSKRHVRNYAIIAVLSSVALALEIFRMFHS